MEDVHVQLGGENEASIIQANPVPGSLRRTFLESMVAGHAASGEVVAICADPGTCKTQLAKAVSRILPVDDTVVVQLTGLDADMASARLARLVRRFGQRLRKGRRLCFIIDDVCPVDECSIELLDRSILKLQKLGAKIILTMRPEAEQMLDGIEGCMRVGKDDLMVHKTDILNKSLAETIMCESGGVPCLVEALLDCSFSRLPKGVVTPLFGEALSALARESLRDGVIEEERKARFAAMLLGEGTWEELLDAIGHAPADGLGLELDEAVLIKLDHVAKTFRCVGVDRVEGAVFCSELLRKAAARWPEQAEAAVRILADRGDVRRAALIIGWLDGAQRRTLLLRHGFDLLENGETALVDEAISDERFVDGVSPYVRESLETAYRSLWSRTAPHAEPARHLFATADDERGFERARLMVLSRRLLATPQLVGDELRTIGEDDVASRLAAHAEAIALICKGRAGDSLRMVRMTRADGAPDTLSKALLCIDEEVARVLMCEELEPDFERISQSEELFERMGFTSLVGWGGILESLRDVIRGREPSTNFDGPCAVAERRGNQMLAAALGCANVLYDLLRNAPVNASVRIKRAAALAERSGCAVLADVVAILRGLCAGCLGEPDACEGLKRRRWANDELGNIAAVAISTLSGGDERPSEAPLPTDFLWLAMAIGNLPEAVSGRYREHMAARWRQRIEEFEQLAGGGDDEVSAESPYAAVQGGEQFEDGIEMGLFGELTLAINGVEVPGNLLTSRSAGTVLAFIAAAPGHRVSRASLIESVWPGVDLESGRERMYQALSRIRRIVRDYDESLDPISVSRNDGTIGLNPKCVRCDIDEFLAVARDVMTKEGSDEGGVIEGAVRLEKIYRGDLVKPLQDGTGVMRDRRRELRRIFVDIMVLGSESALILGRRRLAMHLAERASLADGTREDVMCALIRALKGSGRSDEAVRQYRAFAKRMMRGNRKAPSAELRAAIGNLIEDSGDARGRNGFGKEA